MKISKQQLKKIIREELHAITEGNGDQEPCEKEKGYDLTKPTILTLYKEEEKIFQTNLFPAEGGQIEQLIATASSLLAAYPGSKCRLSNAPEGAELAHELGGKMPQN